MYLIVRDISEDSDDVFIKFMKQDRVNFMRARKEDECWVPFVNVIAQVNLLLAQGLFDHLSRAYRILEIEFQNISETLINTSLRFYLAVLL